MTNKKTSEETAAAALTGAELVRIVQSGASVKTTAQAIADLGGGGGSGGIPDLANDPNTTTDLTYGFKAGTARNIAIDGSQDDIAGGTVDVADDTVGQFIYMDPVDGFAVKCNPEGIIPERAFMMAIVDAAGGQITQIQDKRPFVNYLSPRTLSSMSGDFATWNNPLTGLDLTVDGASHGLRTSTAVVGADGVDGTTLTLADDATNYVEVDADGVVTFNTSGFTATSWPIAKVLTSGGNKDGILDARAFIFLPNGASGSFTSDDGKTVTVVKGVITAIV